MILSTSSIAPFYFRVGHHRVIIVNFLIELIIEDEFVLMAKPSIRKLISNQPQSVDNYIQRGEKLFNHYKIPEKID